MASGYSKTHYDEAIELQSLKEAVLYVALFTSAPDDTGAGTEADWGGYARESVAFGPIVVQPSGSYMVSVNAQSWSGLPGADLYGIGLYDDPTAGNLRRYAVLSPPLHIYSYLTFPIAALVLKED